MIIENLDAFKVWLSKTLDPICEADPSTLSKYVLALVKKEKPETELKDICIDQLDVFLQGKTKGFVDTLFTALNSKSYLIGATPEQTNNVPPPTTQAPTQPVNASSKPPEIDRKKERVEKQNSDDGQRESKRRRSRSPSPRQRRDIRDDRRRRYDGHRSRYSPDRRYGRRRSRSLSPRRRDRRSPDRGRVRSRDRSRSPRSRSRSRSWSRNRSRSRSRSRSKGKGRQPDSRGSTPTLDNGRYSTASAIPTIQSVASTISHQDKPGETTPAVPTTARPRCRDYDEKGFCMRGDLCPFDHGLDPVVVEDIGIRDMSIPPPNLGGPPPTTGSGNGPRAPPPGPGGRTGPPPQPRVPGGPGGPQFPPPGLDGPPPPLGSMGPRHMPPHPPRPGPDFAGEGYNPEAPALTSVPPPGYWSHRGPRPTGGFFNPQTGRTRDLVQVPTLPEEPPRDQEGKYKGENSPPAPMVSSRVVIPQKRPHSMMEDERRPFMGRGRGRGYMSPNKRPFDYGRLGGFRRQMNNENATLEVRKVPKEFNNIAKLNEHFGKFGTLVNVQICYQGDPEGALVTFSSNSEAHAAHKSSEPVFNNRFIKVFWHRKDDKAAPPVETDPEVLKAQYKEKHEQQQQENLKQKVLVTFSTTPESLPTPEQLRIPARARLGVAPANKVQQVNNSTPKSPVSPVEKGIVYTSSVGNLKKTVFNAEAQRLNKQSLTSPTAVKTADFVAKIEAIKKGEELKKEAAKKRQEIYQQKQELLKKQIEQQKKLIEKLEKNKSMSADDKNVIMTTLKALSDSIEKLKMELLPKGGSAISHKSPEQTRKEILDTELELMTKSGNGEDTTVLKKKLLELTREASALGLLGGRGRGRGRGRGLAARGHIARGRGSWMSRGRGRGTGGSLSLDKRPRTLQIKGFDLEEKDEIQTFFSQTCGIEKTDYNENIPSAIITFSTRKDAEKAFVRSAKFRKPLTAQWYTPLLRTVSVVSDDSLTGTLDDDEDESQVEDELDEAGLLGGDDEEDEDEESRSWRR